MSTVILNYFKLNAGSAASYPFSYGTVTLYAATLLTDTLELSNQRLTLTVLPHLSVKVPGAATDISVHIDAHYCTSAWAIYNLRYRDSTSATMLADTLDFYDGVFLHQKGPYTTNVKAIVVTAVFKHLYHVLLLRYMTENIYLVRGIMCRLVTSRL